MAITTSPAAQNALLNWVNSFPLDINVGSLDRLNDGLVLSRMLEDIDSANYSPKTVPTLKTVATYLTKYIQDNCKELEPLVKTTAMKSICQTGASKFLPELLPLVLMAAAVGPQKTRYIPAIRDLDEATQKSIMSIIQYKIEESRSLESGSIDTDNDVSPAGDTELEFERRYGDLLTEKAQKERENEYLIKKMADLTTRLETLNASYESLQTLLTEAQDSLRKSRDGDSAAVIMDKERKIHEQDGLIESQETQIEQYRVEKAQMQKTVDQFRKSSEQAMSLSDEVAELRHHNLELAKKANTIDRYKQKLESQKDFEKENKDLQFELTEIREQIKSYDGIEARNRNLEQSQRQYRDANDRYEVDLIENIHQRDELKREVIKLEHERMLLRNAKAHDEQVINDLQERLNNAPTPVQSDSDVLNLEDELNQSGDGYLRDLENSRLKAENLLLKGNAAAGKESSALRLDAEEREQRHKHLESKYNDLFEKYVVLQDQMSIFLEKDKAEGSEAFVNLRKAYHDAMNELQITKRNLTQYEADNAEANRELLLIKSDLSMIEKDELDALEELKATQETVLFSVDEELKKLRSQHRMLQADADQQKSHLIEALLAKDKILQALVDKEKQLADAATGSGNGTGEDFSAYRDKMEKDLQDARAETAAIKEAPAVDDIVANLRRENALMASAWHDVTSRLQSNNVVLQRRSDAPRSWLNKQIQMVNATTPRR